MAAFEEILQTLRGRRDTAFANAAASRARRSQNWQDTIGRVQGALEGGLQRQHERSMHKAEIGVEERGLDLQWEQMKMDNPLFLDEDEYDEWRGRFQQGLEDKHGVDSPQVKSQLLLADEQFKDRESLLKTEIQGQLDALEKSNQHELAIQLEDFVGRQGLLSQEHRQAAALLALQEGIDLALLDAEWEQRFKALREEYRFKEAFEKAVATHEAETFRDITGPAQLGFDKVLGTHDAETYRDIIGPAQTAGRIEEFLAPYTDEGWIANREDIQEHDRTIQSMRDRAAKELKGIVEVTRGEKDDEILAGKMALFLQSHEGQWERLQLGEKLSDDQLVGMVDTWAKLISNEEESRRKWLEDYFTGVMASYLVEAEEEDTDRGEKDASNYRLPVVDRLDHLVAAIRPEANRDPAIVNLLNKVIHAALFITGRFRSPGSGQDAASEIQNAVSGATVGEEGEVDPDLIYTLVPSDPSGMNNSDLVSVGRSVLASKSQLARTNITVPSSITNALIIQAEARNKDALDTLRRELIWIYGQ